MRKAINWALDRTDYVAQAGPYAGTPWTHLLLPGFPGSITAKKLQPYAPTSNIAKARSLAAGHFRSGRITVYFRSSGATNNAQAEIVRRDLIRLGFDEANITMKGFTGGNIYDAWGVRGNDGDIAVSMGSCSDYPDADPTASSLACDRFWPAPSTKRRSRRLPDSRAARVSERSASSISS